VKTILGDSSSGKMFTLDRQGNWTLSAPAPVKKKYTFKKKKPSSGPGALTDMQKLLIKIITLNGGSCPFQTIIDEVSKSSTKLKRRDGTHYSSDSVRAVKASLSNNTYSIPIFKRDQNTPDCWLVADKMFVMLLYLKMSKERSANQKMKICLKKNYVIHLQVTIVQKRICMMLKKNHKDLL